MQTLQPITTNEIEAMRSLRELNYERWISQFARTFYSLEYEKYTYAVKRVPVPKDAVFVINGVRYKNLKEAHSKSPFCNMTIRKAISLNGIPKGSKYVELYIPDNLAKREHIKEEYVSGKAVKVRIDGVIYNSKKEAAEKLNLGQYIIRSRLESPKYPNYEILECKVC